MLLKKQNINTRKIVLFRFTAFKSTPTETPSKIFLAISDWRGNSNAFVINVIVWQSRRDTFRQASTIFFIFVIHVSVCLILWEAFSIPPTTKHKVISWKSFGNCVGIVWRFWKILIGSQDLASCMRYKRHHVWHHVCDMRRCI